MTDYFRKKVQFDTLQVEYWRCEEHRGLHFNCAIEVWEKLRAMFERVGFKVAEKELVKAHWGPVRDCDIHRMEEILASVYEVQGLPVPNLIEGGNHLAAIESLVAKYSELK